MVMDVVFVTFAFLASIGEGGAAAQAGEQAKPPAQFKITTRREDDEVRVQAAKDHTVFTVKSPFGISQTEIERLGPQWPEAIIIRVYLKGLSLFQAKHGAMQLDATVSIEDGKPMIRLWKGGDENARVDAKDPLWINFRVLGEDGKPATTLPLRDGYFEAPLPRAFFAGNPRSVVIRWIDFGSSTRSQRRRRESQPRVTSAVAVGSGLNELRARIYAAPSGRRLKLGNWPGGKSVLFDGEVT
jgi:hypothetical protein